MSQLTFKCLYNFLFRFWRILYFCLVIQWIQMLQWQKQLHFANPDRQSIIKCLSSTMIVSLWPKTERHRGKYRYSQNYVRTILSVVWVKCQEINDMVRVLIMWKWKLLLESINNSSRKLKSQKEIITVGNLMLISVHYVLLFYFPVFSLFPVSIEKIYKACETLSHHISKHLEVSSQWYCAACVSFSTL